MSSLLTKTPLLLTAMTLAGVVGYHALPNQETPSSVRQGGLGQELTGNANEAKLVQQPAIDLDSLEPAARQIAIQVPKARKILEKWRESNPQRGTRNLHVVYWTPSDKAPAARYQERLQTIMKDVQKFYAGKMESLGFGKAKTIGLDLDKDGALKIHFVTGKKTYDNYQVSSGAEIRRECLATLRAGGVDAANETLVLFCNMSVWDESKRLIKQNSPYYAAGSNVSGNAWQVDSPILELKHLTNMGDHVKDGQYGRISLGKYNTIFIGGITHEIGHALGLPHNKQRKDEAKEFGVALMGSGNRAYGDELRGEGKGAFLTLAHGLKLASHPMFSGYTARMHEDPKTEVTELSFRKKGKGFTVSGKVSGTIPPYAVLAYMDPDGGSDYNATTTSCIPNEDGSFEVNCQALTPNKSARLNLVVVHANGKATSFQTPGRKYSYPYSVNKAGEADISMVQKKLALAPVIKAIQAKANNPIKKLPKDASKEMISLAKRLIGSADQKRKLPSPAKLAATIKQAVLTDCKSSNLKVGYGRATFDRSPDKSMLLLSSKGIHHTGVFAHAESLIVYNLGGKWQALTGVCGQLSNSRGTVGFTIIADGKEILKVNKMKGALSKDFKVSLKGVKTLELITTDGGDGIGSDWSAWFDMQLNR